MAENVWIQSKYQPWEKDIIDYFTANGKWDKVIWTSKDNPDKTYVDTNSMTDIKGHVYHPVPQDIYDAIYPDLYQYCDMYSRTAPDGSQQGYDGRNLHDYMNIFNMTVSYGYHGLRTNNISLFILFAAPHGGRDFILYRLASIMGIKTLIMEQSLVPNKFFYYFDQFDFGDFSTSKMLSDYEHVTLEKKYEKDLLYMRNYLKSRNKKETLSKKISKYLDLRLELVKGLKNKSKRKFAYLDYINKLQFLKDVKEIEQQNVDFDAPFVYFPLHLQPEKTTSSWGGKYNDQALAIEDLSAILPPGWKIYVKENPKQKSYFMRGKWFYKRLKAIDSVVVVDSRTDTYELLKKCKFVATITGTVGWEAITGGKNVLIFGWGVWYKNLPGVFKFHKDINVQQIMEYKIDHSELEHKFSEMIRRMGTGVITKGSYKKLVPDYSDEKNIKNILNSLERILYN